MTLTTLDWLVIAAYFALIVGIGFYYRRRATKSSEEYFAGGRRVGWFLAGTSLVATTFAADTPLAVTGFVANYGIAGNWLWWSMLLSGMLTVFFFARLWRRAGILTDVELAELRYGGKPAAFLRGFRALYLALPINLVIMGWVNLAMAKILSVVFPNLSIPLLGVDDPKLAALFVVFGIMLITTFVSSLSGLWGVMVADLFQFFLMMGMMFVLAYYSVSAVGGIEAMKTSLAGVDAQKSGGSILSFVPEVGSAWMPVLAFAVYLAVQWWATWYPGAEPGGGGYVTQRILSAKDEKNSLLATLWFNVAHYAIRPWPWILAALASVILYPTLEDKESGFIKLVVDPQVFPPAFRGVMIAAFAAAYMSTIATHLNWGSSYLVNDFYRRFLVKGKTEKHYVGVSQVMTLLLMVASCIVTSQMDSIQKAWQLLIAVGAGTGSVFILRWFWWRVNAWSEVSAMVASLVTSITLQQVYKFDTGNPEQLGQSVLITVGVTMVVWIATTLLTSPESKETLLNFYRRVRPNATFWGPIARDATDIVPQRDGFASALDWMAGCGMVYAAMFGVGRLILGPQLAGLGYLLIATGCGLFLYWNLNRRDWRVVSDAE